MPPPQKMRFTGLGIILLIFVLSFTCVTKQMNTAMAAETQKLWVDNKWNILTLVPKDWEWQKDFGPDIPVVFLPAKDENRGIPDFVFVTHFGKQTKTNLDTLKDEYIKGLKEDLKNFKLNSAEKVATREGLAAYDLSYTFKEGGNEALGYDRLVFTSKDVLWAISFSAGKENFKRLKDGAMRIIDSFIFDAAKWLEERQKKT